MTVNHASNSIVYLLITFSLNYIRFMPAGIFLFLLTMSVIVSLLDTPFDGLIGIGASLVFNDWDGDLSYSYRGSATPVFNEFGTWFLGITTVLAIINLFFKIKVDYKKTFLAVLVIIILANIRVLVALDATFAIILSVLEVVFFAIYLGLSKFIDNVIKALYSQLKPQI